MSVINFDFTKVKDVVSNYGVIDKIVIDGNVAWERPAEEEEEITGWETNPVSLTSKTGLHSLGTMYLAKASDGFYFSSVNISYKYACIAVDLDKGGSNMPVSSKATNDANNTYTAILLPRDCKTITLLGLNLNLFDSVNLLLAEKEDTVFISLNTTRTSITEGTVTYYLYTFDVSNYSGSGYMWFVIQCFRSALVGTYSDMSGMFADCSLNFTY